MKFYFVRRPRSRKRCWRRRAAAPAADSRTARRKSRTSASSEVSVCSCFYSFCHLLYRIEVVFCVFYEFSSSFPEGRPNPNLYPEYYADKNIFAEKKVKG